MKKNLSYKAAFSFGFSAITNNVLAYLILCLYSYVILVIAVCFLRLLNLGYFSTMYAIFTLQSPKGWFLGIIILLLFIATLLFMIALSLTLMLEIFHYQMVRFALALYMDQLFSWDQFFEFSFKPFFSFCVERLIFWWVFLLGWIAFLIPALYWASKYFFAGYSIVDGTSQGISEDRAYTGKITRGVGWQIIGFMIILVLLYPFAMPLVYLMTVHAYKQLEQQETELQKHIQ